MKHFNLDKTINLLRLNCTVYMIDNYGVKYIDVFCGKNRFLQQ